MTSVPARAGLEMVNHRDARMPVGRQNLTMCLVSRHPGRLPPAAITARLRSALAGADKGIRRGDAAAGIRSGGPG